MQLHARCKQKGDRQIKNKIPFSVRNDKTVRQSGSGKGMEQIKKSASSARTQVRTPKKSNRGSANRRQNSSFCDAHELMPSQNFRVGK